MITAISIHMHWLTLVLLLLESYLFVVQLFYFLNRPEDRKRLWYLILLSLLILFNGSNGLLPDPTFNLDLKAQYMVAYGMAYLTGAYFPLYFYKVYNLTELRFHAFWGVPVFTLLPYLVFDVIFYAVNSRLIPDRELGVLIPGIYGVVVLTAILRAIIRKYNKTRDRQRFRCELAVWTAVIPWEAMCVFAFLPAPQWLRICLGNLGWLVITLLQFRSAIRFSWYEHKKLKGMTLTIDKDQVLFIIRARGLSERIAEVTWLWAQGHSKQAIADGLFISKDTVKSHIGKLYKTLEVSGQDELIRKLNLLGERLFKSPRG